MACYAAGDDFITVASGGSALFTAGQIIHEGSHKALWEAGITDHPIHEGFAHYVEFEFYQNFDEAARQDPDVGDDYRWYRQDADGFLRYVCAVRYQFTNCQ